MKAIVLGASGQLGQCIAKVAKERKFSSFLFPSEQEANILDEPGLMKLFAALQPDFVINCAAYTAVDKAEDETELASRINCDGVRNVARCCNAFGATLIHISTDFVFKGNIPRLLSETDIPEPVSVYGSTKLEGERAIAEVSTKYYILRTSWLYSEFGNNFVKTMLRLGQERKELGVIADQVGTPTYAVDLAKCILDIISSGKKAYGIYHYSNEGVISWFDFAKAIFEISDNPIVINPLRTSEYPTRAQRPAFSALDKNKIKSVLNCKVPYWRVSLQSCLEEMHLLHPPVII